MRGIVVVLAAAALLALAVTASDTESDAQTSEDLSHLTAAERKLLGYINVRGPRKNWVNKYHRVHLLSRRDKVGYINVRGERKNWVNKFHRVHPIGRWGRKKALLKKATPAPVRKPKVEYRYKTFPFKKFLKPLQKLASRMQRQRQRGRERYLRLRKLLVSRGLLSKVGPTAAPKISAAAAAASSASIAHEKALEQELASLKAKIAVREAEAKKILGTQRCDAGLIYYCRHGKCACTDKTTIQCRNPLGWKLRCRKAAEIGTVCRCSRLSAAGRRRAAAAAAAAARKYVLTCSIRSAKCRRARELQRRSYYSMWTSRRQFLNRTYDKLYGQYVELLARYFKKKYRIMIREYVRAYKRDIDLKRELRDLVSRHKAAMLHHAKLHQLAFMRYSKLMASYKGLDVRYNKLVDKYRVDVSSALNRLKQKKAELGAERRKVAGLRGVRAQLSERIRFLKSEVSRHAATKDASDARRKALTAKHEKLIKKYEEHKKRAAEAIKNHESRAQQLQDEIDRQKEVIAKTQEKIATTKKEADTAAANAKTAYATLKKSLATLKRQTAEAAEHNKAAMAALSAKNAKLETKVAALKKRAAASRGTLDKTFDADNKKYDAAARKAAKAQAKADKTISGLSKKLKKARAALKSAVKAAKDASKRLKDLTASSRKASNSHAKLVAEHKAIKSKLTKDVGSLRKRVASLEKQLVSARTKRSNASDALRKAEAAATDATKKERAVRGQYDALRDKYRKSSEREKAAEEEVSTLKGEVEELVHAMESGADLNATGVDRANIVVNCGKEFKALREANKKYFAHRFDHYDFYKVRVSGPMTSDNIFRTCSALKLQTPCDHPAYSDGRCTVVMKSALHFSYNGHHTFPRWLINRTYWYTNQPLSLYNTGTTHRWSNSNDRDGYAMCVLPTPCQPAHFSFKRFRFYRLRVPGQVSNAAIIKACKSHGLEVPCDHPGYADGKCVTVDAAAAHFSYNPHHNLPRKYMDRAYFYSGSNYQYPLQNWRNTHRWAGVGDRDGLTLCVAPVVPTDPKKVVAKWHGYNWYRIRIHGAVTSEKIHEACKKHGYDTPCDHPAYANGHCTSVMKQALHLSYSPHHDFPRSVIDRMYFYTGNNKYPLQNWEGTHRWANAGDMHGDTLCIKRAKKTNPKKALAQWRGYNFFKVRVPGQVSNAAIYKACNKLGYQTICDHEAYEDNKCVTVLHGSRHMSYSPHHDFPKQLINRIYFYTGAASRFPLQNWRNTHRWAALGDRNVNTLCVKRVNPTDSDKPVATWHGYEWYKVRVTGRVTSVKIAAACEKQGLATPCDHPAYADGHCWTVMKRDLHLSYSPHHDFPRSVIDGMYFYTGYNREPLQNWEGTHRWARAGDHDGDTLCVRKLPTTNGYVFTHNGFKFYRERVPGQMTPAAVRDACAKKNMFVPCDHPSYADGHCIAVVKQSLHLSYNPHHSLDRKAMDRCYFYAGQNNRLLQNWRNTHRWSGPGDFNSDTMCVTPVEIDSKNVVATWKGYKFHKALVEGPMTNENIAKACSSRGFRTPCDHSAYADGQCVVINGAAHMSYNGHHNFPRSVIDRTYWYTGANRAPLQNWRNTHRWANPTGDMWEYTLCIE